MAEASNQSSEDEGLCEDVITVSSIRIGALSGYRDAWTFAPVPEGAFAVIRPENSSVLIGAVTLGNEGQLYQLDVNDKASRSSDELLYLFAPGRYTLWWTLHHERYVSVLEDPTELDELGQIIEVRQYQPPGPSPLRQELSAWGMQGKTLHAACGTSCSAACFTKIPRLPSSTSHRHRCAPCAPWS